jgi:hypothetical protein
MVNAGHSICRRRAFVENKRRGSLSGRNALMKNISLFPLFHHLLVDLRKVETVILCEFFTHECMIFYIIID